MTIYMLSFVNGPSFKFNTLSDQLTSETTVVEVKSTAVNGIPTIIPGPSIYQKVQLTRLLTDDRNLATWRAAIENKSMGTIDATLVAYDVQGKPLLAWLLKNAFPAQLEVMCDDNGILVEKVVIVYSSMQLQ